MESDPQRNGAHTQPSLLILRYRNGRYRTARWIFCAESHLKTLLVYKITASGTNNPGAEHEKFKLNYTDCLKRGGQRDYTKPE